jgi:hypothetical protein
MMLDPSSTFGSILDNVEFLRRIVGDGVAAAEFCRMIPYDGTPIKDELAAAGRLRGDVLNPDYDFLDQRLELFFTNVNEALNVTGWIHGLDALSPQLKFARRSPRSPGPATRCSSTSSRTSPTRAATGASGRSPRSRCEVSRAPSSSGW